MDKTMVDSGQSYRSNRRFRKYRTFFALGLMLVIFTGVSLWRWVAVVVPAGAIGVMWYRFAGGTDIEAIYGEGNHFIFPWNKMAVYDTRLRYFTRDFEVLTRDGLMVTVNIATRYRLNHLAVGRLHKYVGPAYVDTLLVPTLGSYTHTIFSQNSTDDVYAARRGAIQAEIKEAVKAELDRFFSYRGAEGQPWFRVDDVLIRNVRFPNEIQAAVNQKMAQYQLREEYNYRLQREELESKRKEIEAHGIAKFQSIVGAGISDTYLRWKGIEATLSLAQSPNAKVVVIGSTKEGMPLILGTADQVVATPLSGKGSEKARPGDLEPEGKVNDFKGVGGSNSFGPPRPLEELQRGDLIDPGASSQESMDKRPSIRSHSEGTAKQER